MARRGRIPAAAARWLRGKGLRTSGPWHDVWREEHACAFTAAHLARLEQVEAVHGALVKALEEGRTLEAFRADIEPRLAEMGWAPPSRGGDVPTRVARIYRTNMRVSRAAGQFDRMQRNKALMPYVVYELGPSADHRPEHVAWDGRVIPLDDPWLNTHAPPNGWGCKCRLRQITARERERRRAEDPARDGAPPAPPPAPVRIGGRDRLASPGIDAGWDYNPGAHRTLGLNDAVTRRYADLLSGDAMPALSGARRSEIVRGGIARWVRGEGFEHFVDRPRPPRPPRWDATVMERTPVAVTADAAPRLVVLGERVAHKHWRRHGPGARRPDAVPVAWWRDVQDIVDRVEPVLQPDGRWRYDDRARGRRLVLRDVGDAMTVVTYHPRKGLVVDSAG